MRPKLGSWKYGYHIEETLNFATKMMGRNKRARSHGSAELKMWNLTLIDFQIHQDICKNMCKARWCTVCADCHGKLLLLNVCRVWNVCDRHRSNFFLLTDVYLYWFYGFEQKNVPDLSSQSLPLQVPGSTFPFKSQVGLGVPALWGFLCCRCVAKTVMTAYNWVTGSGPTSHSVISYGHWQPTRPHPVVRAWKLRYLQQDEVVEYRRIFKHTTERKGQSHSMHFVLRDDLTYQLWPFSEKWWPLDVGAPDFQTNPAVSVD